MMTKRTPLISLATLLMCATPVCLQGQYATDWLGNSFGTNTAHVGNAARSMWVAPEGVIYTSSMWDENAGSIGIYQNGATVGSIGTHSDSQGGAITGNATNIFTALQYNSTYGSGNVGRYVRSSKTRDLVIPVSADTTEQKADVITGLATSGTLLYASDHPGNRVRVFTTAGVWQRDITVSAPGALAVDSAGDIWVAQMTTGKILEFSATGAALHTITLASTARPSALYYDGPNSELYIGDQGPDMNIKIYNIAGTPAAAGTFGVIGGYLDSTQAVKGTVGAKRFTRVVGIGKDSSNNLYVLNNPWGGSWDLGRNGGTDIHAYNSAGTLLWKLQGLNFEAAAAPDPAKSGSYFYSGNNVYAGTAGGTFVANTVDPITYPTDQRISVSDPSRGELYGQLATLGGRHILVAGSQNPDIFYIYSFSPTTGYIAIPSSVIPGPDFNTTQRIRAGFCIDSVGDLWVGLGNSTGITHYTLASFDSNNKPAWSAGVTVPVPSTLGTMVRLVYLPATDTMILAAGIAGTGSTNWTSIGTRVEVYHGWKAGNTTSPNPVITLTRANPKSIAAAGNYLFVAYAQTTPDVDAFNLTTGALDQTLAANPATVYLGNDVDSMYGIRAYETSGGQYVVTKDNYNGNSLIVERWTP